jgi:hypothetical protein
MGSRLCGMDKNALHLGTSPAGKFKEYSQGIIYTCTNLVIIDGRMLACFFSRSCDAAYFCRKFALYWMGTTAAINSRRILLNYTKYFIIYFIRLSQAVEVLGSKIPFSFSV